MALTGLIAINIVKINEYIIALKTNSSKFVLYTTCTSTSHTDYSNAVHTLGIYIGITPLGIINLGNKSLVLMAMQQ